jgi:hypothetical protein
VSKPLLKHRKTRDGIKTGAYVGSRDKPGRRPVYWPGGVRCEGGASLICGFCMELGKAGAENAASRLRRARGGQRERTEQQKLLGAEYHCGTRWRTGS